MSKKDLVLSEIESVVLLLLAFILCAYGVGGLIQGSIAGGVALFLGIVCVGLRCLTLKGLKYYIRGESCDESP